MPTGDDGRFWSVSVGLGRLRSAFVGSRSGGGPLIDRGQRSSPDMFFANVIPVSTHSFSMLARKCVSVCYVGVAYFSVKSFCISVFQCF